MTSSGCSMRGCPPKKRKGYQPYWGWHNSEISLGGDLHYFPGFGDLQPYEAWNSEFALRAFPGCVRICSGFRTGNA